MTESFEADVAELWEVASARLRNTPIWINRLEELLIENGVQKSDFVFDVSGGFGSPVIELSQRGWQMIYSDGSPDMFARAFRRAEKENAPLFPFITSTLGLTSGHCRWQDLQLGSDYRAIFCLGNSLPYVASWGVVNPELNHAKERIEGVLRKFYDALTSGGILFVDKQPEAQDSWVENLGKVVYNDQEVELIFDCRNDKRNKIRYWNLKLQGLNFERVFPFRGYLILEEAFLSMLSSVGFRNVEKRILDGDIYEGFICRK